MSAIKTAIDANLASVHYWDTDIRDFEHSVNADSVYTTSGLPNLQGLADAA